MLEIGSPNLWVTRPALLTIKLTLQVTVNGLKICAQQSMSDRLPGGSLH